MRSGRMAGSEGAAEAWPWGLRKAFLEACAGLLALTLRHYESASASFCAAIEERRLGIADMDSATTERLQRTVIGTLSEHARSWVSSV